MDRFSKRFLDDLRLAMPVFEYAKRVGKVEKAGSEWRLTDNHSVKIDARKNVWGDFGSGNNTGGDVIALERFLSGCSFEEAVEKIARMVGLKMPESSSRPALRIVKNDEVVPPDPPDHPGPGTNGITPSPAGGRTITATYDYVDADGGLVYQTCRLEWIDDGKKKKSFGQRRLAPDGAWAWGLSEGSYLRSRFNGEWYLATKERLEKWRDAPTVDLEAVDHRLYRFDELREEMAQHESERRTIFIVEGEKDSDSLSAWGLVATTNSGGAKHWLDWMAEEFRDADVVLVLDNDKAGREREAKLGSALRPFARNLRALWWPDHWPGCPAKGDVTDWIEKGGGTVDKFFAIIDKLEPWTPKMPESSFGAMRYVDIDKPGKELTWLVKGVLTAGEISIWYGAWGSGKSFLITDCAMAIARGNRWMGNKTLQGLVMYQAGEGALGLRKRLRAYRQYHKLPVDDDIPFVLLPSRIDIFANDIDMNKLIAELIGWKAFYDHDLRLLVLDTLNAAAPGADENQSRDIGPVINRARKIAEATGAHVALVDHTPKDGGSPRGWSGKMGNVDNAIAIARTDQIDRQLSEDGTRNYDRPIREWTVAKQKDEADQRRAQFILKRVVLGKDEEGDEISSCIVDALGNVDSGAPAGSRRDNPPPGYHKMNPANEDIMRCLVRALKKVGRSAPAGIDAPPSEPVITIGEWQAELIELQVGHEEITTTLRERLKKRIQRACRAWDCDEAHAKLIVKQNEYVWRTTRKVHMVDPDPPKAPKETQIAMALKQGESIDDVGSYLAKENP